MLVLFLISVFVISVQLYVIYNLYNKYEKLENEYQSISNKSEEDSLFIFSIRNRIMSQRSYLKQLDRKGAFESDDEIGYFFKELKKIVNDISLYFDAEIEETNDLENNQIQSIEIGRIDGN